MNNYTQKDLDIFANKMLEDYDNNNPGTIFKRNLVLSNDEALILQSKVSKLRINRGEKPIGYKIGCIAKETQIKMGFNKPARGTLWENELHKSGVELNKRNYTNPSMEAEFGVKLNRDIDPNLASFDYIMNSVHSIYPLIEIHNLVFNGQEPHGSELLANNAVHAGVVLGHETILSNDKRITDLKLIYDDETIDIWTNKKWPEDILSQLKWLIDELSKNNKILKKDDLILTGAYGFPVPINEKQFIKVSSSEFGSVEATFV